MIIQIPFSGFYDSIHNSFIDDVLENQIFTDYATGCTNNDKLSFLAWDSIQWNELYLDYAKEYAALFADEFNINMQFESMTSPKEYNFTTDRIFCEISESEVLRLFNDTDKNILAKNARDTFTSRSGFISFYNPDYLTWDDVLTWDCNQLHVLLDSYIDDSQYDDSGYEYSIIEDLICNGFINELIYKHCTNKRLFKIHNYLQSRIERVAA
jgi:hypothetical protein